MSINYSGVIPYAGMSIEQAIAYKEAQTRNKADNACIVNLRNREAAITAADRRSLQHIMGMIKGITC